MWVIILMGLVPICLYAIIWLGWIKSWYILLPLPGKFNSSAVYALLPWGLAFVALWLSAIFPAPDPTDLTIWSYLFMILVGVGLLFIIWCPSWLKPSWVRWLEREYGYGLHILLEEARAIGRWQWEARVRTRAGLESWVQEILEEREEDMHRAWRGWVTYQVSPNIEKAQEEYGMDIPLDQYVELRQIPYVPEHRKEDYQEHLMVTRKSMVRALIVSFEAGHTFTVADLEHACPGINCRYLKYALDELRAQGYITCTGRGHAARWHRIDENS
ncbi:MAG: hypothetical protein GY832_19945 [Chloroflexi bacterium]|nr:hypothetical protein [Chloroflexota bacterium]